MIEIITKEKIPQNFEELKELCKSFCEFRKGCKNEFILVKVKDNCFWFSDKGTMEFPGLQYTFVKDLNPPQMWGIIKSLKGDVYVKNTYKDAKSV